jgi:tetratricopeptide (TPR) repeat protein
MTTVSAAELTAQGVAAGDGQDRPGRSVPCSIREELEPVLQRYDTTFDKLMDPMWANCEKRRSWPWAIVFFREELPVAGHVAAVRGLWSRVSMASYSVKPPYRTSDPDAVPTVGVLFVARKAVLAELARKSPLFAPAWEALSGCSGEDRWFCISDSPSADWVKRIADGDGRRYVRAREKETRRLQPEGYESLHRVEEYAEAALAVREGNGFEFYARAQQLVERFPHRPRAHVVLADACLVNGDEEGAVQSYRNAIRQARAHAKPLIEKLRARVRELKERDCLERDVCCARAACVAVETREAAAESWRRLADFHMSRDDLEAAFAACRWGIEEDPCCGLLQLQLAELHRRKGDAEGTIAALTRAAEFSPDDGYPWYLLGEQMRDSGWRREAWRCFENAARLSPEVPFPWRWLGQLAVERGFHRKGVEFCRKATEIDPDDPVTWNVMGYGYALMGHGEAAIDAARRAVKLERNEHTWETLGKAYAAAGRPDPAIKCFLKSIALDWYHGEAWHALGMTYLENGQHDKALEVLAQLKRIDLAWAGQLGGGIDALDEYRNGA